MGSRNRKNRTLRRRKTIKVSTSLYMRLDGVVPFAMKRVALQIDALHLRLGDFAPDGVFAAIQSASDLQSLGRGGLGDEIDDRFGVP